MAQVAFDTLKFVETLETAGLPKEQAKAISLAVRESYEVFDVATKRNLEDVCKELSAEIANVRKEMEVRFDKVDAKFEKLGIQMTIRLGLMIGAAVSIIAAILKM